MQTTCNDCGGKGTQIRRFVRSLSLFIPPFFILTSPPSLPLTLCVLSSRLPSIPFVSPCRHCKANKIVPSRISLSIHLPPGAPGNFEVVFDGDADESPDWEAGDVIVRVKSERVDRSGAWGRKERSLVQRIEIGVEEVRFF